MVTKSRRVLRRSTLLEISDFVHAYMFLFSAEYHSATKTRLLTDTTVRSSRWRHLSRQLCVVDREALIGRIIYRLSRRHVLVRVSLSVCPADCPLSQYGVGREGRQEDGRQLPGYGIGWARSYTPPATYSPHNFGER